MLVCGICGQENPDGFRFCGACAAPLPGQARPVREERKVVTALFCDLVGSTAQTEQMDVEDVQVILSRYHDRVAADIERWGGTVEKFIGDAVVALFGVPVAHEDDPERAVRAALAVRDWVSAQDDVHVRIAINTGEALVQIGARAEQGEHLATGDVLNTAARLQSAAPVDGILVGEQTHRATDRVIEYRDHVAVEAKGKAEPVPVWEVVNARSRYGSDLVDRPTHPLVGRERELGVLRDALARCQSEQTAQFVTLVGIPGIGKSRLVSELMRIADASRDVYYWRQGRSLPYGESQSFWALAEIVKAQAGILESDGADEARGKLSQMLDTVVTDREDRAWIEVHLLALIGLASAAESSVDSREQAFTAWRRLLEGLAEQRPLILVFEDLHWADDGLLDFVDHLADWATTSSILLVGTARPELLERRPTWGGGKRNATTLSIAPLSDEETQALLGSLLDQVLLPVELHTAVLGLAAGNPLYAEEYVRMLQDRGLLTRVGGTWHLDERQELPLPDTIHGLVAARIDGLVAAEKDLLRDASVVGKVFWPSAVVAIAERGGPGTESLLHSLERKEFIRRERRSAVARETQYAFLHAIVREVAYRQIPRGERAHKHAAVAAWIEQLAPDRSADRVEMLAHHYRTALELTRVAGGDETEILPAAREALVQASERAETLNSWASAQDLAAEALELSDGNDPDRPDLALRISRASMNLFENDVETAITARELSIRQGSPEQAAEAEAIRSRMLWHLGAGVEALAAADHAVELVADRPTSAAKVWAMANRARAASLLQDHETAIRITEEVLPMATTLERDDFVSNLLNSRGMSRVYLGDQGGLDDVRRAVEAGERARAPWMVLTAQNNLANLLWELGRIEEGGELLGAYRETTNRFGMQSQTDWVDAEDVFLAYLRGEYHEVIRLAEAYLKAREGQSYYMEAPQRNTLGHAYATVGRVDMALAETGRGLELAREATDPQNLGFALVARAQALWLAGRRDEAGPLLDELLSNERLLAVHAWLVPLPMLLIEQRGSAADCAPVVRGGAPSFWREAIEALMADRLLDAADIYARIGSRFVWAWTLLLAAERGQLAPEHLAEAAAHFERVGATPFLRRIDALTLASA